MIWTDVVQMFIYVAGALVVFGALLWNVPGGWAEVVRLGGAGRQVHGLRSVDWDPTRLHALGRSRSAAWR